MSVIAEPDHPRPLQSPIDPQLLDRINGYLNSLSAQDILRWGLENLPNLYQTTAFGLTGLVQLDMLSKLTTSPPPLIFVDTLYHFKETLGLVEEVKKRYGRDVHVCKPEGCKTTADFEAKHGTFPFFLNRYLLPWNGISTFLPTMFTQVEPARRAYAELNVQSVITGRRASQGAARKSLQPLEVDSTGLFKLNPLFSWSFSAVQAYINENNVPRNALLDQGYKSIGDWHSTQKAGEGDEGERAGRWANNPEKTECGLHEDYFKIRLQMHKKQREAELREKDEARGNEVQTEASGNASLLQEVYACTEEVRSHLISILALLRISAISFLLDHDVRSIVHERTSFTTTSRRSLSESLNRRFVVIQRHQPSCSRSYSSSSPFPSSSSSSSSSSQVSPSSLDPAPLPDSSAEQSATQAISEDEVEDYLLVSECDPIDPEMLPLKPDLEATGGLPPIPLIKDEAVRQQVFTHRSVYARARHEFEDHPQDPSPDYEILEFQGDAVLGLVITDLVRDCYPSLRVGPATAYVGGLYKDQGLEIVRNWLTALFLPYVKEAYRVCRNQHGLPSPPPSPFLPHAKYDPSSGVGSDAALPDYESTETSAAIQSMNGGHLQLFNQFVQQKHMRLEWSFEEVKDVGTRVTPIWAVHTIVNDQRISVGRGNTKKAAQDEAAREALVQLGITTTLVD
ncbi:phosphoadenylyl-sulfate reductase [Sanghuangporus baumii]|uniref:Phosphoadenylyl-sulfate reductase n=1 Tax=Sanghuangporus baumii TaxID=108892 RepID=A0A9Q5HXG1_SANBA|nr:phosphoadenylyl-sulfate reductase [Sanghuangporus baumii]